MIRFSKSLVCVIALLVLFGVAGVALADEMTGTIARVGVFEDGIAVRDENGQVYTFRVIANSNARLNMSQVRISSLQAGDRVRVLYDNKDGTRIIKEIDAER
jgi:hypothetical protein